MDCLVELEYIVVDLHHLLLQLVNRVSGYLKGILLKFFKATFKHLECGFSEDSLIA
jgi:hypothetical protein